MISPSLKYRIEDLLAPVGRRFSFRFYFLRFIGYYWAIPDRQDLPDHLWDRRSEMVGIDLREREQACLAEELAGRYGKEFAGLAGGMFGLVDAEVLYGLIRRTKPRRVIEIGAGQSTMITARALKRNRVEDGIEAEFTSIEPYPSPEVRRGMPGLTRLLTKRVQDVPLDEFERLGAGDVLFIDSSHVLAIGSDVQYEFLEILPRLRPGVFVHVHDIFLPAEYHKHWVREGRFWSEQYVLQAFLAFNDRFEVVWAGQHMHLRHGKLLEQLFPGYDRRVDSPSSFWIRRSR